MVRSWHWIALFQARSFMCRNFFLNPLIAYTGDMLERMMHGYASVYESKNCCSRCLVVFTAQVAGFLLPSPGCSFTNFRLKHRGLPRPAIFFSGEKQPNKSDEADWLQNSTNIDSNQSQVSTQKLHELACSPPLPWLAGLTSSHRRMIIVKTTSYSSQN